MHSRLMLRKVVPPGLLLFLLTRHDFLRGTCRHLADSLALHSLGYFLHDTRFLCHLHSLKTDALYHRHKRCALHAVEDLHAPHHSLLAG